jgi:exodeoxyribonuclease VII small subunit
MADPIPQTGTPDPPTFEQAMVQLEAIVHELEDGRIGLEEALTRYEQGVGFLRRCHDLLARAERRIELLHGIDDEGNAVTTPLEDESGTLQQKAARRSRRRSTTENPSPSRYDDPDEGGPRVDESSQLF